MSFHFVEGTPDEALFTEVKALNGFNATQFADFVGRVFTFLVGQPSVEFMEGIGEFASEHGVNVNALKGPLRGALIFFKGALRSNLTPSHVQEDLTKLGLDKDKTRYVALEWKKNFLALSHAVSGQTLMVNELVDMEWRFGITSGSSELFRAGSTFLQLKFMLDKGGESKQHVNLELTLPQFYEFLHEMEKAKTSLEFLSG